MKRLILVLLSSACAQYRLVGVQVGLDVNINAVQRAFGFTWPREVLNAVRRCEEQDSQLFDIDVLDLENCIVARTQTMSSCPTEFERLMIEDEGAYTIADVQLVTVCLQ